MYESEDDESDPSTDQQSLDSNLGKCKRSVKKPPKFSSSNIKWTISEKVRLFNGLIKYGSSHPALLAEYIETKNEAAVKLCLTKFKHLGRLTLKQADGNSKDIKDTEDNRSAPIDIWLEYILRQDINDSQRLLDLSRVVKYIALFEPRTSDSTVSLSDCYKVLSDLMLGESPQHMNAESSLFLYESLQRLAREMKMENPSSKLKFMRHISQQKTVRFYKSKKAKTTNESSPVSEALYNPLTVPESLLVYDE